MQIKMNSLYSYGMQYFLDQGMLVPLKAMKFIEADTTKCKQLVRMCLFIIYTV